MWTKSQEKKFKYLEKDKSFYDEIKSILDHFLRAFIEANKGIFLGRWESDFKDFQLSLKNKLMEMKEAIISNCRRLFTSTED